MHCDLPVGVFLDVLIEGISSPAHDFLLKFGIISYVGGVYISLVVFCVEPDMVLIPLNRRGSVVRDAFFPRY